MNSRDFKLGFRETLKSTRASEPKSSSAGYQTTTTTRVVEC